MAYGVGTGFWSEAGDEIGDWVGSAFDSIAGIFGGDDSSGGAGNIKKSVGTALKLGMLGSAGTAHSNAQAAPFHYQSNANPVTTLKTGFDYTKNDIDVNKGFNSFKGLFNHSR